MVGLRDRHAALVYVGHHGIEVDIDAYLPQIPFDPTGQMGTHRPDQMISTLDEDDPGVARIDALKVIPQRPLGELSELPSHFHPGRASTNDDEGHETTALRIVRRRFSQLKCAEYSPTEGQGVVK